MHMDNLKYNNYHYFIYLPPIQIGLQRFITERLAVASSKQQEIESRYLDIEDEQEEEMEENQEEDGVLEESNPKRRRMMSTSDSELATLASELQIDHFKQVETIYRYL